MLSKAKVCCVSSSTANDCQARKLHTGARRDLQTCAKGMRLLSSTEHLGDGEPGMYGMAWSQLAMPGGQGAMNKS